MWAERDKQNERYQKKTYTKINWRHELYVNITKMVWTHPEYHWRTIPMQLLPAEHKDKVKDQNQDSWTGVLCTAEKALWWVYYVTQVFSGDRWDLCGTNVFLKEEKSTRRHSSKDMSGTIILIILEPDSVHYCQMGVLCASLFLTTFISIYVQA